MIEEYKNVWIGCTIVAAVVGTLFIIRMNARSKEGDGLGCFLTEGTFFGVWVLTCVGLGGNIVLVSKLVDKAETIYSGDKYVASVVNYVRTEHYDEKTKSYRSSYRTVLGFTTKNYKPITYTFEIGSNKVPKMGKLYEVYYNEATGITTTFSLGSLALILILAGILYFALALFLNVIGYSVGISTIRFWKVVVNVGVFLFIPLLMLVLESAFLYRLFVDGSNLGDERTRYIFLSVVFGAFMIGYIYVLINIDKYRREYGDLVKSYVKSRTLEGRIRELQNVQDGNNQRHL